MVSTIAAYSGAECAPCAEAGAHVPARRAIPDDAWLSDRGDACRDRGEAVNVCWDCMELLSGCPCGLAHWDDYADALDDAAIARHAVLAS